MYFAAGEATFTLSAGESITATGLPAGIGYTVTETDANGYETTYDGQTGTIEAGREAEVIVTNTRETGDLTVQKVLVGAKADPNKDWTFTVTLDDTINGTYGGMTFVNGVATFTLKGGQSRTATGLPAGITYTVTEAEANTDGYVTTYTGETGRVETGKVAEAVVTNTLDVGDLTVSKTLVGEKADPNKDWTFTVTLSDTSINGTYGGMTFVNGVATFTLKGGQSLTATGLPAGIPYTVTETEANTEGYVTTSTGETGEIPADREAKAEFTNTLTTGNLVVSKVLEGETADTEKDWTFTVTLSDTSINGTYGGMTFVNGVATFTLKGGESLTAEGLPAGITYTVTEAEANADGYKTTSIGETGEIPADATAEAVFTNTLTTGSLTVSKVLEGKEADADKDWTFTVTLSDDTINGTYGGMTFANGVATFTLKGGESLTATGLPAGITYTVTEAEANTDSYITRSTGESGVIPAEDTAEAVYTNTIGLGDLTVTKILEGETADPNKEWTFTVTLSDNTITGTFGGMEFTGGVATFTLKGGESLTATGLPAGITYTVTEAEANTEGYVTRSTGESGVIPAEGTAEAVFTNTIGVGDLTVTKILEGETADPNKNWTFTVTLSDSTINGTYGSMTFVNGVATFTLKGGQSLTATGLPAGITYTVTEAEANTDGYVTSSTGASGTIPPEGEAQAVFTNTIGVGDLTVSKIIEGEGADPNKDWTFTVTLSDTTINGTYGGMTFVNGVATFTLKGGESLTATGLPAGITYTVTEAEANTDGYKTTSTGETGTIPPEGEAVAIFVNSKETGDLTVVKIIEGKDADPNKDWTFTVTLSDTSINGTYGGMTFVNGVATFTLKGGQSLTATGLPAGITYTVTEAEANTDGYTTRSAGDTGTIPAGGEAVATFVNEKGEVEKGAFAIRKRVRGEGADPNQVFHFIITLNDRTINGQYGDVFFVDGMAEVELKDGQHVWAMDLPVGVTYTVVEVEANQDGYQTLVEGDVGAIEPLSHFEARFTNYRGPGEPDEDEPWEDLPDPNVPLAPPPDNPPQTNDQTPREMWMLMLAAAFVGMTTQLVTRRKREKET